ncbi:MAG: hypothetical protein OEW69_02950 [Nitrospirota bacterium]|nr:hypothetical protein [Nitrospirota bacterium]
MKKEEFYEIVPKEQIMQLVREIDLPAFIYFKKIIEIKYNELLECLPENFNIHYAFKANPNKEVLNTIQTFGMGADVASLGELMLAGETGYLPEKIEFTGPGKTLEELSLAIDLGISSINVESISEIGKIATLCREENSTANIGIRVNPHTKSSTSAMKMSGDTQFGITEDDLEKAFTLIKAEEERLHFTGIHMHLGSQFLDAEKLVSNFRFILEKAYEIAHKYDIKVEKINFGGGWGIDMFAKKPPLDLSVIKQGLSEFLNNPTYRPFVDNIRLVVEPGRFLVAECGLYAVEILYRKRAYQKEFLVVNGGMHQHYTAAGGIGQVIRRNYEIDVLTDERKNKGMTKYTISGSLCIPDDILATEVESDVEIKEGDVLIFFNSGAYAFSASPLLFLSHPLPKEIVI